MTLPTIVGRFSKGSSRAVSVNYSESAGPWCFLGCRWHPDNPRRKEKDPKCYADKLENLRPNIRMSGQRRRRLGPVQMTNLAFIELKTVCNAWVRFCAFGAMPPASVARKAKGFAAAFRSLILMLVKHNCDVHLPTDSPSKTKYYRDLVGDLITVRQSVYTRRTAIHGSGQRAYAAGSMAESVATRVEKAQAIARAARDAGSTAVVCPAKHGTKCGDCCACACPRVDLVIYVAH